MDKEVISIQALEQWHRLKIHGIPLMRYLREVKMNLPY